MSIESEFKKFVVIAERIAVALEKPAERNAGAFGVKNVNFVDEDSSTGLVIDEEPVVDETAAVAEGFAVNEEPLIDVNQTMDDIAVDAITSTVKKEPVINEGVKPVNLTFDDVKEEARILVDNFPENRKGFEKAKKILKKLGADELDALVPEKFAEAVNAFRKAVKTWS